MILSSEDHKIFGLSMIGLGISPESEGQTSIYNYIHVHINPSA